MSFMIKKKCCCGGDPCSYCDTGTTPKKITLTTSGITVCTTCSDQFMYKPYPGMYAGAYTDSVIPDDDYTLMQDETDPCKFYLLVEDMLAYFRGASTSMFDYCPVDEEDRIYDSADVHFTVTQNNGYWAIEIAAQGWVNPPPTATLRHDFFKAGSSPYNTDCSAVHGPLANDILVCHNWSYFDDFGFGGTVTLTPG